MQLQVGLQWLPTSLSESRQTRPLSMVVLEFPNVVIAVGGYR